MKRGCAHFEVICLSAHSRMTEVCHEWRLSEQCGTAAIVSCMIVCPHTPQHSWSPQSLYHWNTCIQKHSQSSPAGRPWQQCMLSLHSGKWHDRPSADWGRVPWWSIEVISLASGINISVKAFNSNLNKDGQQILVSIDMSLPLRACSLFCIQLKH